MTPTTPENEHLKEDKGTGAISSIIFTILAVVILVVLKNFIK